MQGNPFGKKCEIPPVPLGWPDPVMANGSFNAAGVGPVDHSLGLFAEALSFSMPAACPPGPEAGEPIEPPAAELGPRPDA